MWRTQMGDTLQETGVHGIMTAVLEGERQETVLEMCWKCESTHTVDESGNVYSNVERRKGREPGCGLGQRETR